MLDLAKCFDCGAVFHISGTRAEALRREAADGSLPAAATEPDAQASATVGYREAAGGAARQRRDNGVVCPFCRERLSASAVDLTCGVATCAACERDFHFETQLEPLRPPTPDTPSGFRWVNLGGASWALQASGRNREAIVRSLARTAATATPLTASIAAVACGAPIGVIVVGVIGTVLTVVAGIGIRQKDRTFMLVAGNLVRFDLGAANVDLVASEILRVHEHASPPSVSCETFDGARYELAKFDRSDDARFLAIALANRLDTELSLAE